MLQNTENSATQNVSLEGATLISFRICPFVARAKIVADEKNVDMNIEFIDLANKPDWFLNLSPTGTVPALRVGEHFIFESSVIADLIDEATVGSLYPVGTLDKFQNKSWIEYAASIIRAQYFMLMANSRQEFERGVPDLLACLERIEKAIVGAPFFNGDQFCVIDATYAPLLCRFEYLKTHHGFDLLNEFPKLERWKAAVIDRPSVVAFHSGDFDDALETHLAERGSFLARAA